MFKNYKDLNGDLHWIPENEEPKEDWVEVQPPENPVPDMNFKPPYTALRQNAYPYLGDQLDMLYHDINNGVFGETAKTSEWYNTIKDIKESIPKE